MKIMAWSNVKTAITIGLTVICVAGIGTAIYKNRSITPAARLQEAMHIKRPAQGTWSYPSEKVMNAIYDFGSNRADAFPILEGTVRGSDMEARKQAVAAVGLIARPAMTMTTIVSFLAARNVALTNMDPRWVVSIQGEPAINAGPLLRKILFADNDLSPLALTSLHGLFEARDIPALAALLAQSHNGDSQLNAPIHISNASQAQTLMNRASVNQQLQRYLPEEIEEVIGQSPQAAASFVSSVEDLMNDANPDVCFGAACALAKYKGVSDPKISAELTAGLKIMDDTSGPRRVPRLNPQDDLKQLMAVELLQRIGPDAKPMIPALLDYARSTHDRLMREHALAAIGYIDPNLRNNMPEVDEAVKNDQTFISMARVKAATR